MSLLVLDLFFSVLHGLMGGFIAYRRRTVKIRPCFGRSLQSEGDKNNGNDHSWNPDSICRDNNRGSKRLFYAEWDPGSREKGIVGLCLRYYGGSFRVVSFDSGYEDFRESGAPCFFAGCGRILLRDPVFDVS